MSIWDGDHNPLNVTFPTMGGKVFWKTLQQRDGYTLQQHILTKHCRILNRRNFRVEWGQEGPMRAELIKLCEAPAFLRARYGDVIGVHRAGGIYDHYGVYESDKCIYEYGMGDSGKLDVHITTLSEFTRGTGNYFVLVFPESYGIPGKIEVGPRGFDISLGQSAGMLSTFIKASESHFQPGGYRLYGPAETIARAQQRVGEEHYNLVLSNCEHYAVWCKTGLSNSHQIDAIIRVPFQKK